MAKGARTDAAPAVAELAPAAERSVDVVQPVAIRQTIPAVPSGIAGGQPDCCCQSRDRPEWKSDGGIHAADVASACTTGWCSRLRANGSTRPRCSTANRSLPKRSSVFSCAERLASRRPRGSSRPHQRKQDHVADRLAIRQQHDEPIDPDPSPPVGGSPYSNARM